MAALLAPVLLADDLIDDDDDLGPYIQEHLLYVFDISSYGSTYPQTNVTGIRDPSEVGLNGTLTPFGKRQMYLKGREMQKRYVHDRGFLDPNNFTFEVAAVALPDPASQVSAQAFFAGLYSQGDLSLLDDNQTANAVPPFPLSSDWWPSPDNYGGSPIAHGVQSVPIYTAGMWNWKQQMLLKGNDEEICPIVGETRYHELLEDSVSAQAMRSLNDTFMAWLTVMNEDLQFNDEGQIITIPPPIVTSLADQVALVNEIMFQHLENRYLPYDLSTDDFALIEDFARQYSYYYMNGNATIVALANTMIFREIQQVFNETAFRYWSGAPRGKKYSYKSTRPETLATLLRGFDVSYKEWPHHLVPRFASSIIIKLYSLVEINQNGTANEVGGPFDPQNYFVSLFIDDVPIPIKHSECFFDGNRYRCNWGMASAFFA